MQSTYDPRVIKKIIPGAADRNSALIPFFGLPDGWNLETGKITPEIDPRFKDASPVTHLTPDDPPIFLLHFEKANKPGNIHHPNFGKYIKEAMDQLNLECIRRMDSDYPSLQDAYLEMAQFVLRHFDQK